MDCQFPDAPDAAGRFCCTNCGFSYSKRVRVTCRAWTPDQPSRGLGDSIAKLTHAVGIKPCRGCKKRQAGINKLVPYTPHSPLPSPDSLAVCIAHFNPCGWARREANFRRFAEAALAQGARLCLVSAGRVPSVDGLAYHLELPAGDTLWQKERALNLLIDRLPDQYDKVAWVDADVLFDNPDWVRDTCRQLDATPVAQLFERALWLDREGVPERWHGRERRLDQLSVPAARCHGARPAFPVAHTGFAWAARRETLRAIDGLYDRHILGSGDTIMSFGFHGPIVGNPLSRYAGPFRRAIESWCMRAFDVVGAEVGYVPGTLRHLWHGTYADRQYNGRLLRIAMAGYNPDRDLELAENGLWRWSAECPDSLRQFVEDYFYARQEDGSEALRAAKEPRPAVHDARDGDGHLRADAV